MSGIHPEVINWLLTNNQGKLIHSEPVGGGCIHQALRIKTTEDSCFFLKQNDQALTDIFEKEARGLEALQIPGGPVVPKVFLVGGSYLLLEDLQPSSRCQNFWQSFGRQMAVIHTQVNNLFGFQEDNYIGKNPQENDWMENGHDFFRERRLKPQLRFAQKKALLNSQDIQNLERLMRLLPELIPEQPASLLHGDLWSGNLITDNRGMPAIIDPAVYFGWAEADLAMTDLFGTYPPEFYGAYNEVRPLDPDYQARYPIYNLYHLLNHLNLFGRGYLSQVRAVLSRFA